MYTHLKDRKYYEDLYDKFTVENARRGMSYYYDFLRRFRKTVTKYQTIERPGNAFVLKVFYMQTVGNELLARYEKRDEHIRESMDEMSLRMSK